MPLLLPVDIAPFESLGLANAARPIELLLDVSLIHRMRGAIHRTLIRLRYSRGVSALSPLYAIRSYACETYGCALTKRPPVTPRDGTGHTANAHSRNYVRLP